MDKLKVIELFSGIGSQSAALKRIGVEHEVVATADLDKEAMVSYAAIHCNLSEEIKSFSFPSEDKMARLLSDRNIGFDFKTSKRFDWFKFVRSKSEKSKQELKKYYCACVLQNDLGDINEIDELPLSDFWTYSFPCQDISVAGKGEGIISGKTRSGCLYEVERLLNVAIENWNEPKYLMLENVKNLVGKKFIEQFKDWIRTLDDLGYNTYWQVLNAKKYGIPQNRERVFAISIRKDCDDGSFEFPEPFELKIRLKDVLEESVDEKYYIVNDKANDLIQQLVKSDRTESRADEINVSIQLPGYEQNGRVYDEDNISPALTARDYKDPKKIPVKTNTDNIIQIGNIRPTATRINPNQGRCYDPSGISPASNCCDGGNREPHVIVKEATKKGYAEASEGDCINMEQPNSKTRRGRVGVGVAQTITTSTQLAVVVPDTMIVASRGRNVYNPSDRTPGAETEQRLEPNNDGLSNTITSVQKDNYVIEPMIDVETGSEYVDKKYKEFYEKNGYYPKMFNPYNCSEINDVAPTQTAQGYSITKSSTVLISCNLRIRKLTPRECFRLMGFSDEDFDKAELLSCNSHLYKQAGNSIVVDVLCHIFTNLFKKENENG